MLSKASITKPWVAEELNAAVVKRIQDNTKLIPVILDGLKANELPVAIRHLLFEDVPDRNDFGVAVDRVVRAVFGTSDKPQVGPPPAFATASASGVPGLDRIDALVLKAIGDEAVSDFGDHFHTETFLPTVQESLAITQEQALESLEVLDADRYIRINRSIGSGVSSVANFILTWRGLESVCEYVHRWVRPVEGDGDQPARCLAFGPGK